MAGRKVCTGQAGSKKERRLEEAEEDQRQVLLKEGDFILGQCEDGAGGGREGGRQGFSCQRGRGREVFSDQGN